MRGWTSQVLDRLPTSQMGQAPIAYSVTHIADYTLIGASPIAPGVVRNRLTECCRVR
jgi:hypothetical protein